MTLNSQNAQYVNFSGIDNVTYTDSIANLRLIKPTINGEVVIISGSLNIGDGNGAIYVWSDTATGDDDNATIIDSQYSGSLGRWLIVNTDSSANALRAILTKAVGSTMVGYQYDDNSILRTVDNRLKDVKTINDLGAIGDSKTDNTSIIKNAISYGGEWFVPNGEYLITDISIFDNIEVFSGSGSFLYNGTSFPVERLTSGIIIPVPSTFADIQSAMTYGSKLKLSSDAGITIQVADGTYNFASVIGNVIGGSERLYIRGNETDPSKCVLNFNATNNQDGFLFNGDFGCAWLNGFTINGVGAYKSYGNWNDQCYGAGIRAIDGAACVVGGNTVINQFYYGVSARYGASIVCSGTTVTYAGDVGFHAFAAASIDAEGCNASYCADITPGLGFGFCAEQGGFIDCSTSYAFNNNMAGIYANGGHIWAHGSVCHDNTNYGFYALNGGRIEATKSGTQAANSYKNGFHGFAAVTNSYINANSAFSTQNGNCGYLSSHNSTIDITVADASNNTFHGFSAIQKGEFIGDASNSYENGQYGYFIATNSSLSGNYSTANSNGSTGIRIENGSTLDGDNIKSLANKAEGIVLVANCVMSGDSTSSTGNSSDGFVCDSNSTMRGTKYNSANNTGDGFIARNISLIDVVGMTSTGNSGTDYSPYLNTAAGGNVGSYVFDSSQGVETG